MSERTYVALDKALSLVIDRAKISLSEVEVSLINALGKVLAEDIVSPIDFPPYDRSAVDGYAVCSDAVTSASLSNPIPLKLRDYGDSLTCRDSIKVSTGDRIPSIFDAVVMLEDAYVQGDTVYILKSVPKYGNVSRRGEDFRKGEVVVEKNTVLKPWHIAALSVLGISSVKVYRDLRIGVIATGNEIVDVDWGLKAYEKGFIIDSTSRLVIATLRENRFIETRWYGIVPDDVKAIGSTVSQAIEENDIIITTGGTGPSSRDCTLKALESIGADIIVDGIAMRPGRPTSIAILHGKPIFMLSGFPVAAYTALKVLVIPFIVRYFNLKGLVFQEVRAKLVKRVPGSIGYDTFVRVRISRCGEELCAEPVMLRGSGVLSSLLKADGFLRIPSNVEGFERGEYVWVQIL